MNLSDFKIVLDPLVRKHSFKGDSLEFEYFDVQYSM